MTQRDDQMRRYSGALSIPDDEVALLAEIGQGVRFCAGDTVVDEGCTGGDFYVVLRGDLEVLRGGAHVADLSSGAIVGEMALFNEYVRTSTVRMKTDGELVRVESSAFFALVYHGNEAAIDLLSRLGETMTERMQSRAERLFEQAQSQGGSEADIVRVRKRMMADWALKYHSIGRKGKLEVVPTKRVGTAADLSVAYSPGVAEPCLAIVRDPDLAYEYTAKGHLVGVISNGTAVLGLGNIGALAGKPVMEGKSVLFKRFADVDAFDLEVNEDDPQRFADIVVALEPTFGGVNLEDIKAPECFWIERECQRRMNIPVFHDDQHGTAIVAGAGLLNAIELVDKRIEDLHVVVSGKGAAGFTCAKYFVSLGVPRNNVLICDRKGVVFAGRGDTSYVAELAAETSRRTLDEAMEGADVFLGLSMGGLVTPDMLLSMNRDPMVFALANPDPEIDYPLATATRSDVIMATGRSDYPNQINNVIAFPYIFRGALDCRARAVNETMKLAATHAIAKLAKEGYEADGQVWQFGRELLVPKPFDHRLRAAVSVAVAQAAMEAGVARVQLDIDEYRASLG